MALCFSVNFVIGTSQELQRESYKTKASKKQPKAEAEAEAKAKAKAKAEADPEKLGLRTAALFDPSNYLTFHRLS